MNLLGAEPEAEPEAVVCQRRADEEQGEDPVRWDVSASELDRWRAFVASARSQSELSPAQGAHVRDADAWVKAVAALST